MKKVIGIISIVLFLIVEFQSCAAGLANAIGGSKDAGGSAGLLVGFAMLIAGIIILASRKSKGMVITSIVFYVLSGLIGLGNAAVYKDLAIWGGLNIIFAILLVIHLKRNKELYIKK